MFFPYLYKQVAWFSFHVNYSGLTRRWKLLFSRKKRILVVDDEVGIGKLIQRLIESEDLEVELAHSAEQARQLFYKNHFPVVLLDLDLPDACGIQLLQ
jgi:DNA-binding NtrC family response regulator